MANFILKVQNLVKAYGEGKQKVEVLKGVNLLVTEGESVAIVGPSGVGKSTLLHILGTLDQPTSGDIFFWGQNIASFSEKDLSSFRNRKLGFVFQFHHLLPEFNVLENVMLPALIAGWSFSEAQKAASSVLEKMGLTHRLTHQMGELSGGERQRVAIARALVMNPPLLLADEPTGNLDETTAQEVSDLLLHIHRTYSTTMIIVTHNWELASRMQRICALVKGKIVEISKNNQDFRSKK